MSLRITSVVACSLLIVGSALAQTAAQTAPAAKPSTSSLLLQALGNQAAPQQADQQAAAAPTTASLLQSLGGGVAMPTLSGDNASNAAGVVTYCAKNKYLGADAAASLKDKLLAKAGLQPAAAAQDPGYQNGLAGMLVGSDGQLTDMKTLTGKLKGKAKDKATKKACGYVLDNAGKLL